MSGLVSNFARTSVRRRTALAMTARIEVLRGDLGDLDVETGLVGGLTDDNRIYCGKGRIRTVSGGQVSVGGGEIATRNTTISIPMTAPVPHVDDLVRVLDDTTADPNLNARFFRVTAVDGGGLFGDARRMTCIAWAESRYWGKQ